MRTRAFTHSWIPTQIISYSHALLDKYAHHLRLQRRSSLHQRKKLVGVCIATCALISQILFPYTHALAHEKKISYASNTYIKFGDGVIERVKPRKHDMLKESDATPIYKVGNNIAYYYGQFYKIILPNQSEFTDLDIDGIHVLPKNHHNKEGVKKLLYYGFGGAGFDKRMWPKKDWDGNLMTDDHYYVLTMLMNNLYISDSVDGLFRQRPLAYSWFKEKIFNETSKDSTLNQILHAPEPKAFSSRYLIYAKTDDYNTGELVYMEARGTIQVNIKKTPFWKEHMDYLGTEEKYAGKVFRAYTDEGCTKKASIYASQQEAQDFITNNQGLATSTELPGNRYYYVKQVGDPHKKLDPNIYKVWVGNNDVYPARIPDDISSSSQDTPEDDKNNPNKQPNDSEHENKERETATLKLKLESNMPHISKDNPNYHFTACTHGIYADKDCVHKIARISSNEEGICTPLNLKPATYYIKELSSGTGYAKDTDVHKVVLKSPQAYDVTIKKHPQYYTGSVLARFIDSELAARKDVGEEITQGKARLSDAHIKAEFFTSEKSARNSQEKPMKTWIFSSNTKGIVELSEKAKISGDTLCIKPQGGAYLPLGYLRITQTHPSEGYHMSPTPKYLSLSAQDSVDAKLQIPSQSIPISVERGGIHLSIPAGDTLTQGDASGDLPSFSIRSKNTHAVIVGTSIYHENDICLTLQAKLITKDGKTYYDVASKEDVLPFGDYLIESSGARAGYAQSSYKRLFSIDKAGTHARIEETQTNHALQLIQGGVGAWIQDGETKSACALGKATLKGAEFGVYNSSTYAVSVDNKEIKPNELVCSITTNDEGYAHTTQTKLPYGTYTIRLLKAPEGYELDDTSRAWSSCVSVREQNKIHTPHISAICPVHVMRADLTIPIQDVKAPTKKLVGKLFKVSSKTTGECHVVATNAQGMLDTSTNTVAHSYKTNELDSNLGTQASTHSTTACKGVWFSGTTSTQTKIDDTKGALPFDTYTIEELVNTKDSHTKPAHITITIDKAGTHTETTPLEAHDLEKNNQTSDHRDENAQGTDTNSKPNRKPDSNSNNSSSKKTDTETSTHPTEDNKHPEHTSNKNENSGKHGGSSDKKGNTGDINGGTSNKKNTGSEKKGDASEKKNKKPQHTTDNTDGNASDNSSTQKPSHKGEHVDEHNHNDTSHPENSSSHHKRHESDNHVVDPQASSDHSSSAGAHSTTQDDVQDDTQDPQRKNGKNKPRGQKGDEGGSDTKHNNDTTQKRGDSSTSTKDTREKEDSKEQNGKEEDDDEIKGEASTDSERGASGKERMPQTSDIQNVRIALRLCGIGAVSMVGAYMLKHKQAHMHTRRSRRYR